MGCPLRVGDIPRLGPVDISSAETLGEYMTKSSVLNTTADATPDIESTKRRVRRGTALGGFATALSLIAVSMLSAQPAAAATAGQNAEQVVLNADEAASIASSAAIPETSPTGLAIDRSSVDGWRIDGVVTFVSYELVDTDTASRSFTGAYVDTAGTTISTVDVVLNGETATAWSNGTQVDMTTLSAESAVPSSDDAAVSDAQAKVTTTRDFCWYLNKYAEGEIALGTLVAAAGGVTALFTGPVGAAIAAAGGLKAALGGMYKWLISLWCI